MLQAGMETRWLTLEPLSFSAFIKEIFTYIFCIYVIDNRECSILEKSYRVLSYVIVGAYILSSTDKLFRCMKTLQCGLARGIFLAGIETQLTLRQLDILL